MAKITGLQPLEQLAVIEITGHDAATFLQRQLAVEVSEMTADRSRLGAYLNPKGRVIGNFIMTMTNDSYYLVADKDLAESLAKRLRMYVFRDKVEIKVRESWAFSVGQPSSESASSELPQEVFQTQVSDGVTVFRMPSVALRYGVIAQQDSLDRVSNYLETTPGIWQQLNIESGIPWINSSTSEMFVAQAINLDLIDSVSWTKGCYPGQEIVARLHYRGGINRRMVHATCSVDTEVKAGDQISSSDQAGNQTGTVVNCAQDNGTLNLLVSVPLKFVDQKNLLIADKYPVTLQTNRLPYVIPELQRSKASQTHAN